MNIPEPVSVTSPLSERVAWTARFLARARENDFSPSWDFANSPDEKARVASLLRSLVQEVDWTDLFSECPFNQNQGFWTETASRLFHKLLPASVVSKEAHEILSCLFGKAGDAAKIQALPQDSIHRVKELLEYGETVPGSTFTELKKELADALLVLGSRLSAFGVSREVRRRLPAIPVAESPFLDLAETLAKITDLVLCGTAIGEKELPLFERAELQLDGCFSVIETLYAQLETYGVSVALVYALEGQQRNLLRVDSLLRVSIGNLPVVSSRIAVGLLAEGIDDARARRSIREHFRTNLHLLSRKIVERAGATGEHYITRGKTEYFKMLRMAMGGGIVTVGTSFLKSVVTHLGLPRFLEGCLVGMNYASSFLFIQFCGFTLATKQPSMTASTLAGKLKDLDYRLNVDEFLDEVTRFSRSQFIAIVGNVGAAVPFGILFSLGYHYLTGHAPFHDDYARYTIKTLHPFKSATLFYAAFTGVILWISSLCAGWTENWAASRDLSTLISTHPGLVRRMGKETAHSLAHRLQHALNGIGANVSLGFLLAFVHMIGKALPLSLDVRHVTLSTVSFVFSLMSLHGAPLALSEIMMAVLGLIGIGFFNVWMTFFLSLAVAARARRVRKGWLRYLVRQIASRVIKKPLPFFFPMQADSRP